MQIVYAYKLIKALKYTKEDLIMNKSYLIMSFLIKSLLTGFLNCVLMLEFLYNVKIIKTNIFLFY